MRIGDEPPLCLTPRYPTREHAQAAAAIVAFFADRDETETVLLVNFCARGKAMRDSCLDVQVLVPEGVDTTVLEADWQDRYASDPVCEALRQAGAFSAVHLDVVDGTFDPTFESATPSSTRFRSGNTAID